MADSPEKSIEDILAACRKSDGEGAAGAAEKPAAKAEPKEPAAAAPAGDPKSMSVAEIMAAARAKDGGGAAGEREKPAAPAAETPAGGGKKASEMSVAEIMAAARAKKSAASAAPQPQAAPAAKKAAPQAKAEATAAPVDAGPKDTQSILAAARKQVKPGPMSKAEAAAKGKPVAPTKKAAPPMPEKPAYAQPRPAVDAQRRGILAGTAAVLGSLFGSYLAVGFGSLATVSGLWGLGLARYMFPNILTEPPSSFRIGFPADFAPDSVTTKFKAQYGVWIVNADYEGERMIVALRSVCTHLGCTPNWLEGEQKFKCPCHGSGFYKDGINFEGPAPRPLERYAIRIADDGQLEVDKSKMFQQELGQWTDPNCFVLS